MKEETDTWTHWDGKERGRTEKAKIDGMEVIRDGMEDGPDGQGTQGQARAKEERKERTKAKEKGNMEKQTKAKEKVRDQRNATDAEDRDTSPSSVLLRTSGKA